MLRWLLLVAWRRARGDRGSAVATLPIGGLLFTLDWGASEHVPLREILGRRDYWPWAPFRPRLGQTVVDVGANAGIFAVVAGSWIGPAGRLLAIEPDPLVLGRLRQNLHQNGLEQRAVVVAAGVSDHEGRATLYVGANTATGSLLPMADPAVESFDVRIQSLDATTTEFDVDTIDLLKIDVEGLETEVLDGAKATLARCRRVVIEVTSAGTVDSVIERFRSAGFAEVMQRTGGADSGAALVYASRE
jgi:FkbM family methyltransferase